ncbi:MAG: zinc-ribbon domain-containing protein [Promethearchaeota archaeon]
MKRSEKYNKRVVQNTLNPPENNEFKENAVEKKSLKCRYCDEQIKEDVNFCPFCGSFLK